MIQAASHDIFLNKKPKVSEIAAWTGICSSRCYVAKTNEKKCKCKCCGEHHGKGLANKQKENKIDEYCKPSLT